MIKLSILSFVFLFILKINAQEGPKVVVFNSSTEKEQKSFDTKNLIKLSLLEAFSGDLSLYYERVLHKNLSAELGIGVTLSDYLGIIMDNFDYEISERSARLGNSFALGLRYYPFMASDEFYFSPEFKFRYYHSVFTPDISNYSLQYEESRRVSNFRINVGYVYFFDKKIFIDYYAGIGIASIKESRYNNVYDNSSNVVSYNKINTTNLRPRLNIGVKFGFTF